MTASVPVLEMRGIVKSFPGVKALRGVDLEEWCHALLDVVGVVEPVPWVQYVGKGAVRFSDPVVEREEESLLLLLLVFPSRDCRNTRIRGNIGVSSVSSCGGFCHQGGLDSSRKSMMAIVPQVGLSTVLVAMKCTGACVTCMRRGICLMKLWYDGLSSGSQRIMVCPV